MKYSQKGFGVIEGLLVVIALALVVGVGYYIISANRDRREAAASHTTHTHAHAKDQPAKTSKKYLEFKSAGVKIELNDQTKDAYHGTSSDDEVYISSRAVDSQPGLEDCKASGVGSGILALSQAKVGDDHMGSPLTSADLEGLSDTKIGETYYWLTPANGICWNPDEIDESDARIQKLLDFRKAMLAQQKTITAL